MQLQDQELLATTRQMKRSPSELRGRGKSVVLHGGLCALLGLGRRRGPFQAFIDVCVCILLDALVERTQLISYSLSC